MTRTSVDEGQTHKVCGIWIRVPYKVSQGFNFQMRTRSGQPFFRSIHFMRNKTGRVGLWDHGSVLVTVYTDEQVPYLLIHHAERSSKLRRDCLHSVPVMILCAARRTNPTEGVARCKSLMQFEKIDAYCKSSSQRENFHAGHYMGGKMVNILRNLCNRDKL